MTRFLGVRNDTRCSVGYYDETDPVGLTVNLASAVDLGDYTLTLNGSFVSNDTVVIQPAESAVMPSGWNSGTLYTLTHVTGSAFTLHEAVGGALVDPVTLGSGTANVLIVTKLPTKPSVAKAHEWEWGYKGFNPKQLAFDLLVYADGAGSPTAKTYTIAQEHHTAFADEVVALLPHDGWEMDKAAIVGWLERTIPVTADFAVSSTAGIVSSTSFTYYPLTTGYNLTYVWNFGDGGTSTSETPTHTYTVDDKRYTVALTVKNSYSFDTRLREEWITIGDPPDIVLA